VNNVLHRGEVRVQHFGRPSVCLWPREEEGPDCFKPCVSEQLASLIVDYFDALRNQDMMVTVHGNEVRKGYTKRGAKKLTFQTDFLTIRLQEDLDAQGQRAFLFVELPFSDPAAQLRQARTTTVQGGGGAGELVVAGQDSGASYNAVPYRQTAP
jgi:hypothetical protein